MFRLLQLAKQIKDAQDRLGQVEDAVARLQRQLADLDDFTTRGFDKFRKRHQREEASQGPVEARTLPGKGDGGPPVRSAVALAVERARKEGLI